MKIRTDLAMESELFTSKTGELNGIKVKEEKKDNMVIVRMDVINHNGELLIGKPIGTYITINAPKLMEFDENYHRNISNVLAHEIKSLIKELYKVNSKAPEILVAGLGNIEATPDSLGPRVVSNLLITRHITENKTTTKEYFGVVSAITPGVMAQTGIETSEIISAIAKKTEPDILVVIDSLAARNISRLTSTIQISNTGIEPGSGVGNHRMAINKKTIGIPVIAIGIPTVIDAATLIYDTIEKKDEEDAYYEIYNHMYVTSKDIDDIISRISYTVSEAINICMCN